MDQDMFILIKKGSAVLITEAEASKNSEKQSKIKRLSEIKKKIDRPDNPYKTNSFIDENDLLKNFIASEMNRLRKIFEESLSRLKDNLSSFVDQHVVPKSELKELFDAIILYDHDRIVALVHRVPLLLESNPSSDQEIYRLIQKRLQTITNQVADEIRLIEKHNPVLLNWKWSQTLRQRSIQVENHIITHNAGSLSYNAVLLEPTLSLKRSDKVILSLNFHKDMSLSITDEVAAKKKGFVDIYHKGCSTYSYMSSGYKLFARHEMEKSSPGFKSGHIVELHWDGPSKLFSILNLTTHDKQEFKTDYESTSRIHFCVMIFDSGQISIEQ